MGTMRDSQIRYLSNVLFVANLNCTLISVSTLLKSMKNCFAMFAVDSPVETTVPLAENDDQCSL